MTTNFPTREDYEEFAEGLSDEHLACRSFGHAWRLRVSRVVVYEGSRNQYIEMVQFCQNRCGCTHISVIDPETCIEIYRTTRYSHGYLSHGMGRIQGPARNVMRLESARRAADDKAA